MKFIILLSAVLHLTFADPYHHSNHHVTGPYRQEQSALTSTFDGSNAYVGAKSEVVSGYGNVYGSHGINRNGLIAEPIPYSSIIDNDRIHFKSENHPQLKPEFEVHHPHGAVRSNIEAHSENYLDYLKRIGHLHNEDYVSSEIHDRQYSAAHAAHYGHAHVPVDTQVYRKNNLALSQAQINAVASIGQKSATNNRLVASHARTASYHPAKNSNVALFGSLSNSGQAIYAANQRSLTEPEAMHKQDAYGRKAESLTYIQHGPTSDVAYVTSSNNGQAGYIKRNEAPIIAYAKPEDSQVPVYGVAAINDNSPIVKHDTILDQNKAQTNDEPIKSNVAYVSSNAEQTGYMQGGVFQNIAPGANNIHKSHENIQASINNENMQYVSSVNAPQVGVAHAKQEAAQSQTNVAYVSSQNGAPSDYTHAGLFQQNSEKSSVGILQHLSPIISNNGQLSYVRNNDKTSQVDNINQYQPHINHASVKYVNNYARAENQAPIEIKSGYMHQLDTEVSAATKDTMSEVMPIERTPYYNQEYVSQENVRASALEAHVSPQYIGGAYSNYARASSVKSNEHENSRTTQLVHDVYDAKDYANLKTVDSYANSQLNTHGSAENHHYSGVFGGLEGTSSRTMTQAGMREYLFKRATNDLKLNSDITKSITESKETPEN